MFLSTPRNLGDNKVQKPKIFLKSGEGERLEMLPAWLHFGVSTGAGVQALCTILLTLAKMNGVHSFCPLSCFMLGTLALNMALFRVFRGFLEGFMGFVWVCVACVLCVACVGFVRVWS